MTVRQDDELNIEIVLDAEALPREVAAIEEIARDEGIRGPVSATLFHKSLDELPWAIYLLAPVSLFFSAFLTRVGNEAGRDAYQAVRRLVCRLCAARRNKRGSLTVRDSDTFTHIALRPDLPEEAYRQLSQMGPEQLEGGYWMWDFEKNQWGPGKLDSSDSTK
ncbi:MAG: hypothetical protein OXG46_08255 [Chloroflexi bacterium]|nr:hypothetical protein [Chloroflexota bacterium]MCY3937418.1 hypothetical protein [Chloroflexota bacterium]